jgi:hypothetical protein
MGFMIEISLPLVSSYLQVKEWDRTIHELAEKHLCVRCYTVEETLDEKLGDFHTLVSIMFEDKGNHCQLFLEEVLNWKREKKRLAHIDGIKGGLLYIESIVYENEEKVGPSKLVYASPYYLKCLSRDSVNQYHETKRKRSYSEDEKELLQIMYAGKGAQIPF